MDAVLRATTLHEGSRLAVLPHEHMLAMMQKLGTLRRRFSLLTVSAQQQTTTIRLSRTVGPSTVLAGRRPVEARLGRVDRASGCTDSLAEAIDSANFN